MDYIINYRQSKGLEDKGTVYNLSIGTQNSVFEQHHSFDHMVSPGSVIL